MFGMVGVLERPLVPWQEAQSGACGGADASTEFLLGQVPGHLRVAKLLK